MSTSKGTTSPKKPTNALPKIANALPQIINALPKITSAPSSTITNVPPKVSTPPIPTSSSLTVPNWNNSTPYMVPELPDILHNSGLRGWKFLRANKSRILEFGTLERLQVHRLSTMIERRFSTPPEIDPLSKNQKQLLSKPMKEELLILENLSSSHETSIIHSSIPFLPIPAALICCFLNVFIPGSGTIASGLFLLCVGRPRINLRQSRISISILVNIFVGIAQLCTVTFLLVGWFWSLTWGGLLVIHSVEYKRAIEDSRREAVVTEAIEAFTGDSVLHRKHVLRLVKEARVENEVATNNKSKATA